MYFAIVTLDYQVVIFCRENTCVFCVLKIFGKNFKIPYLYGRILKVIMWEKIFILYPAFVCLCAWRQQ